MSDIRTINPIKILHISDLHFGAEDSQKLKALRKDVEKTKLDLICITGDIVNFPRKRYFQRALDFIRFLENRAPVFVVPGNHDAFFGGPAARRFTRYLDRSPEFGEVTSVGSTDVCVFGVNSTFPSLRHLSNSGKVTEARLARFRERVQILKAKLGEFRYGNAYKIVLLHHHPIATISNEAESMLYLKKSGEFLTEMVKHEINIILHGHQHDPCDFSINYNVGGERDSIVILSAGTALKKLTEKTEEQELSKQAHYFVLDLANDILTVQGMNWHADSKTFKPNKGFVKQLPVDPAAVYEVTHTYVIKENTDLEGGGEVFYKTKAGRQVDDHDIGFGVDSATPNEIINASGCNLVVYRNGIQLDPINISTKIDFPRDKIFTVKLVPPISTKDEKISWSYRWPRGWENLFKNARDEGQHFIDRKTKKLTIIIRNESPAWRIGNPEVIYHDRNALKIFDDGKGKELRFEVNEPKKFYTIYYAVTLNRSDE